VNQSWTGWAVAVNSGGTFLASPILGKWTDWRGVKEALFISLIVMIGGNIMYALSQDVWMLLASRFIVGCAAGTWRPTFSPLDRLA
jgi:predicted MFS family arabinose efflux permease